MSVTRQTGQALQANSLMYFIELEGKRFQTTGLYDDEYAELGIKGEIPINDPHHLPLPYPTLPDDEEERDLERLRQLGLSPATDLFGVMLELDRLEDRDVQKASSTPSSKLPEGSS